MYPTNELDPCPFCSGCCTDKNLFVIETTDTPQLWYVQCDKCGARGPYRPSREKAILSWNNRDEFRLKRDGMEKIRLLNNNDPLAIAKEAFVMTAIFAMRTPTDVGSVLQPGELLVVDHTDKPLIFYILDFFECACGRKQPKAAENKMGIGEKAAESVGWRKINGEWRCPFCCNNTEALFGLFEKAIDEAAENQDKRLGNINPYENPDNIEPV